MSENPSTENKSRLVLLVEDSLTQLMLAKRLIESAGFEVVTAENGVEGINAAFAEHPDIIVSDVVMPELNGYQMCRLLKEDPLTRHVPVILLTALENRIDKFWAAESGADVFVSKPQLMKDLLPALARISETHRARSSFATSEDEPRKYENAHHGVQSKLSSLLERLLLESSITNRLRRISLSVEDPGEGARRILDVLARVLDFHAAVLSLPLSIEAVDYVAGVDAESVDELLGTGKGARVDLQGIDCLDRRGSRITPHIERIELRAGEEACGELSMLLTMPPTPQTRRLLELIEPEVSLIVDSLLKSDRLRAIRGALEDAYHQTESFLTSIASILIGVDGTGRIRRWNVTAEEVFGIPEAEAIGKPFAECGILWLDDEGDNAILHAFSGGNRSVEDLRFLGPNGEQRFFCAGIHPLDETVVGGGGFVLLGSDTTDRRRMEMELHQARKLEAIGQLASGIAHEINTPTQYVSDNTSFLKDAFQDIEKGLVAILSTVEGQTEGLTERIRAELEEMDLDYLREELPRAIDQSLEGLKQISKIVLAMKDFAHPGGDEAEPSDLNRAIEAAITVSKSEWKYAATVETDLDDDLPAVRCNVGQINQVILNLLINAAHAIEDAGRDAASGTGKIRVTSRSLGDRIEIRISDSGTGIPPEVRERIFEPFFTTKQVGRGSGQGLAIAHGVVVQGHSGSIDVETEVGEGTTFVLRLPVGSAAEVQDLPLSA